MSYMSRYYEAIDKIEELQKSLDDEAGKVHTLKKALQDADDKLIKMTENWKMSSHAHKSAADFARKANERENILKIEADKLRRENKELKDKISKFQWEKDLTPVKNGRRISI